MFQSQKFNVAYILYYCMCGNTGFKLRSSREKKSFFEINKWGIRVVLVVLIVVVTDCLFDVFHWFVPGYCSKVNASLLFFFLWLL